MADQFPEIILISAPIPAFLTARLEFAVLYRMVPTMWNFMEVKKVGVLGTWVPEGFAASYASLTKKLNPSSSPPLPSRSRQESCNEFGRHEGPKLNTLKIIMTNLFHRNVSKYKHFYFYNSNSCRERQLPQSILPRKITEI